MKHPIRFNDRTWILCDHIVPEDELGIVLEIANVIAFGDEIDVARPKFVFPFDAKKSLVKRNGARSKRERPVVVIAEEVMRAQAGNRLSLPGEEMVPAKREGELAEVCRRKLVHSGHIRALDHTPTGVITERSYGHQSIKFT